MPSKPTNQALADALKVTIRRVTELKKNGMPCQSIAAAKKWRAKQAERQQTKGDSAEELRQRRIALLRQQERKAKLEADRAAGELMPRAEHTEVMVRCATACRCALWALINTLPPMLAGLDEPRIARQLEASFRECLDRLHHGDPELWDSPIGQEIINQLETRIKAKP